MLVPVNLAQFSSPIGNYLFHSAGFHIPRLRFSDVSRQSQTPCEGKTTEKLEVSCRDDNS